MEIYADEPERNHALDLCVRAWHDLGTCRSPGWQVGPIPWTAMVAWCDFHELDREASMILIDVIRQLDVDRASREASRRALEDATRDRR